MHRLSLLPSLLAAAALALPVLSALPAATAEAGGFTVGHAWRKHHRHGHHGHWRHSRRHHYGYHYGYYPYYSYPAYPYYRFDTYVERRYEGTGDDAPPRTGWQRLAEGHDADALYLFRRESEAEPQRALPKVGYSLAAAALGELGNSVWAMRRALTTDPESVPDVPVDEGVRALLDELIERFLPKPHYESGDMDDYFMLAALHYLAGELPEARIAIGRAVQKADTSASTRNLQQLIGAASAEEKLSLSSPGGLD